MDDKTKPHRGNGRKRGAWREMDEAPRDGRSILCVTEFGEYDIAGWDPIILCWVSKRGFYVDPARWLPLPRLPADLAVQRSEKPPNDSD